MYKKFSLILIYVLAIVFGVELINRTIILITNSNNPLFISAVTNFILYIILVATGIIILKRELTIDLINFKNYQNKTISIIRGYFILLGANFIGNFILIILNFQQDSLNQQGIEILLKSKYMILTAISIVIGPIIEELVFRKSLIDVLVFKWKFSPIVSIIASSLLFGLIHVVFNAKNNIEELILIIPYFCQGIALGYLYVKKDYNIHLPLLVHMLNNFIALLVIVVMPTGF